jgi:hypothetical protein
VNSSPVVVPYEWQLPDGSSASVSLDNSFEAAEKSSALAG